MDEFKNIASSEEYNRVIEKLYYSANHDALTGLYNRKKFYEKTREMLAEHDDMFMIVYWNIHNFKAINEILGRKKADKMLYEMADSIREISKKVENCTYARFDADHFVFCIPYKKYVERLIPTDGHGNWIQSSTEYEISTCFGIYIIDDRSIDVETMCDRARIAYGATDYSHPYAFFDEADRERTLLEQELTSQMVDALANGQFEIYYQPIYDVTRNTIISAEALVRWNHPVKGRISPDKFIPLFEKNGFIYALDNYVWDNVCKFIRQKEDQGIRSVPISVNVSRIDFNNDNLHTDIVSKIKKNNISNDMLRIEVTESAYSDNPKRLLNTIENLRAEGIKVLMDDFGSGYSSLNTLKDIPVDILKIDLKFIKDLDGSGRAEKIIASVMQMAKWLNLMVIAEGAENKAQIDFLNSIGCENVQGYYYSMPISADEFTKKLMSNVEDASKRYAHSIYSMDLEIEISNTQNKLIQNGLIGGMGIYETDNNGNIRIIRVNQAYYDIMCNDDDATVMDADKTFQTMYKADHETLYEKCMRAKRTHKIQMVQLRRQKANKTIIWVNIKIMFLSDNGEYSAFYFSINDTSIIHDYYQEHNEDNIPELGMQRDRYRIIMENTSVSTFEYDRDKDLLIYNLIGKKLANTDTVTQNYLADYSESLEQGGKLDYFAEMLKNIDKKSESGTLEFRRYVGTGPRIWVRCYYVSVKNEKGIIEKIYGRFEDIDKRKRNEIQLMMQANRDSLSGLYNRRAAREKVEQIISQNTDESFVFMILDVDNFKKINDSFGHRTGDRLITNVGKALMANFRNTDVIGRLGGDEFIVFASGLCNTVELDKKIAQIRNIIQEVQLVSPENKNLATISIGVCRVEPGIDFDTLYKRADEALYKAKRTGKNKYVLYKD